MQELIDRFIDEGLTPQQAEATMHTVAQWLEEEYPVAAVLLKSWIKNHHSA
jgi:hypothetical protein